MSFPDRKLGYNHTMEYYSAIKMKELLIGNTMAEPQMLYVEAKKPDPVD